MKTKPVVILMLLTMALLGLNAYGQTNAPTPQNIIQTAAGWLSTHNTNLVFSRVSIWDGPVFVGNAQAANEFGAAYDLWRADTNNASGLFAGIEARTRQLPGVGTPFISQAGGVEFGTIVGSDTKVGLYMDASWRTQAVDGMGKGLFPEVGAFIFKKMTSASGAGMFLGWSPGTQLPIIGAQLNFQF